MKSRTYNDQNREQGDDLEDRTKKLRPTIEEALDKDDVFVLLTVRPMREGNTLCAVANVPNAIAQAIAAAAVDSYKRRTD